MTGVNEIRSSFLDYFRKHGHEAVASSPLVPRNDPTLMFTNAGMVQFKNVFTGLEKRPYSRAATAQKCVRAGGKHNDLDNVGYTARHLTFFEMLGNFSFGDYFKERAIELAWNLITRDFGLRKDKLLVTVYHTDDEAAGHWKKIAGFSDDRIIRIPTSDNFWAMGDTGPCGPCSEIFIDRGEHIQGGPPGSPEEDGDRFLEFWNLVFMQFEQVTKEERVPLPRPSIDTGMGLERMASILQGVDSVFETDLFRHFIDATSSVLGRGPESDNAASFRVIADHLRSSCFLVADGVLPSNEGRGYVLRRIMRRAMRHAELLGAREPLMWRLVPALTREMGQAYPELVRAEPLVTETLKLEEQRFRKTLERGLRILDEETQGLGHGDSLKGEVAFKLYDTYGFPLDLTQDALRPRGVGVETKGFEAAMQRQKEEARKAWAGSGEAATGAEWFDLRERAGASEFLGYDTETAEGVVKILLGADGKERQALKAGEEGAVIFNQTPFYGESGGQVGDRGEIRTGEGARFRVTDTQKRLGDLLVHYGRLEAGSLKLGDAVELEVDHERRQATRVHHSATHLLHEALRQVLGSHVAQRGSLVEPGRLRFDFSHPKGMSAEELTRVEEIANAVVLQDDAVTTRLMSVDDAIAEGAMALFGEKYGDEVRVVAMGRQPEGGGNKPVFSLELCGGTHVGRTGEIGLVKVVSEGASAAGIRRIEALAGESAFRHLAEQDRRLKGVASLLKVGEGEVEARLESLVEERRKLEREVSDLKRRLATAGPASAGGSQGIREIAGIRLMARALDGLDAKDLKGIADDGKRQVGSGVVAIANSGADGKLSLVVGVTDDLVGRYNAVELVRTGAQAAGGKGGGGRPDLAQAGGPDGAKAQDALTAIGAAIGAEAAE